MRILPVLFVATILFAAPSSAPTGINENAPVVFVNGEPGSARELLFFMHEEKNNIESYFRRKFNLSEEAFSWFQAYDGQKPIEALKKIALDELLKMKVQLIFAKNKGITRNTTVEEIMKELEYVNHGRQKAISENKLVYGPIKLDERYYFKSFINKTNEALFDKMANKEITVTEEELQKHYNLVKETDYKKRDFLQVQRILFDCTDINEKLDEGKKKKTRQLLKKVKESVEKGCSWTEKVKELNRMNGPERFRFEEEAYGRNDANPKSPTYAVLMHEAYKLGPGEISGVIEVGPRLALIKCISRKPEGYRGFEEIKPVLLKDCLKQKYRHYFEQAAKEAKVKVVGEAFDRVSF